MLRNQEGANANTNTNRFVARKLDEMCSISPKPSFSTTVASTHRHKTPYTHLQPVLALPQAEQDVGQNPLHEDDAQGSEGGGVVAAHPVRPREDGQQGVELRHHLHTTRTHGGEGGREGRGGHEEKKKTIMKPKPTFQGESAVL